MVLNRSFWGLRDGEDEQTPDIEAIAESEGKSR